MKKILVSIIAIFALCTGVYAQNVQIEKDYLTEEYTISGTADGTQYRKTISIVISKMDASALTPTVLTTCEADNSGSFSYSFFMPGDAVKSDYKLVVQSYDASAMNEQFYYSALADKNIILNGPAAITLNNAASFGDFSALIKDKDLCLKAPKSITLAPAEYEDVYRYIYDNRPSGGYANMQEFYQAYYEALSVKCVNTATESQMDAVIKEYDRFLKLQSQTGYPLYNSLTNKAEVTKRMTGKNYADLTALRKGFNENTFLSAIYSVNSYGEVSTLIESYKAIIPFDLRYYYGTNVNVQCSAIANTYFANMTELEQKIKSVYDSQGLQNSPAGGGGGGGSSSGGGGNSFGIPVVNTQSAPVLKEEFFDVPNTFWAYNAITDLCRKKVVSGYGDGTFKPDANITREEFVALVIKAFNISLSSGNSEFSDVPEDHWATQYIKTAVDNGIVSGIGNNMFGTGNKITREDMCVIIYNCIKSLNIGIGDMGAVTFTDEDSIADYAKEAVSKLQRARIVNGMENGEFMPKGFATRAQAAQIIYNILNGGI